MSIMLQTVVVDTSALISVFERRLSLESQLRELAGDCRIVVPSAVRVELSRMDSHAARAASALSARYDVYECGKRGDEGVIEAATSIGAFAVVTNDSILADRLVSRGIRVIRMKGEKRFAFYRSDEVQ